ncbi:MAG: hypothetical protein ACFB21_03425 [Opitutales bacterium]
MKWILLLAAPLAPGSLLALVQLGDISAMARPAGLPYDSVGQIANLDNGAITNVEGSGLYLGGGWVLSAEHVRNRDGITFDGINFFNRVTTPMQVAPGVDLEVFRISGDPGVPAINLPTSGIEMGGSNAYLVGAGLGGNDAAFGTEGDNIYRWERPAEKRWGINELENDVLAGGLYTYSVSYDDGNYTAIATVAGTEAGGGVGEAETSPALFDSGSGLFQQINGTWYAVGLTTIVSRRAAPDATTFGEDVITTDLVSDGEGGTVPAPVTGVGGGDYALYVRLSEYSDDILMKIPEPSLHPLLALGMLLPLLRRTG